MSDQFWIYAGVTAVQIAGLMYICYYINHKQFKLEQEHLDKQIEHLNKESERLKGLK